ncbi:TULIP family P47-like protein, partial [Klebsiella pneumoniae]
FKDTAKVVIAAVIITVVAGVVALIPELIAEVAGGGAAKVLPPIGPFATGATDPVSWPGAGGFTLTEAGLNGAFQFGGNPNFSF